MIPINPLAITPEEVTHAAEVDALRAEVARLKAVSLKHSIDSRKWGEHRRRQNALIAELRVLIAKKRDTENEACAKVADSFDPPDLDSDIAEGIAAAIRARGQR